MGEVKRCGLWGRSGGTLMQHGGVRDWWRETQVAEMAVEAVIAEEGYM